MTESAATASLAVQRRRESRRAEWSEHIKLAALLTRYLDPKTTFWTLLESKPTSRQRRVRSGLPDVLVIFRQKPIFVELKSRRGVASKAQKQIRLEMLPVGADWWMARSAQAVGRAI